MKRRLPSRTESQEVVVTAPRVTPRLDGDIRWAGIIRAEVRLQVVRVRGGTVTIRMDGSEVDVVAGEELHLDLNLNAGLGAVAK